MIPALLTSIPIGLRTAFPESLKNGAKCQKYNLGRMRLTYGSRLGVYAVQSPLGSGGMGEVYRAIDTKLGRNVALKVLPAEMAQDTERLGRFRREAKVLAQLDHPPGEVQRRCQMVEKAMQLNPNYPGVLRFTPFIHAYCRRKYVEALEAAVRINMPGFFYAQAVLAAALGQLGQREAAHKAVQELLTLRPDFAAVARPESAK